MVLLQLIFYTGDVSFIFIKGYEKTMPEALGHNSKCDSVPRETSLLLYVISFTPIPPNAHALFIILSLLSSSLTTVILEKHSQTLSLKG